MKTKTQCTEDGDETHNVRRKFYVPNSPAGKGAKWEWAGDTDDWHTYDMEVQCLIEEAWARVRIHHYFTFYNLKPDEIIKLIQNDEFTVCIANSCIKLVLKINKKSNLITGGQNDRCVKDISWLSLHYQLLQPESSPLLHRLREANPAHSTSALSLGKSSTRGTAE